MFFHLVIFSLLCYGICFLVSDARIFGCDAKKFKELLDQYPYCESPDQYGVIPIRQIFLRNRYAREFLSCYFCIGCWAGLATHAIMMQMFGQYFIPTHTAVGYLVAFILGGTASFLLETIAQAFEA